jgi:hypothetical protein
MATHIVQIGKHKFVCGLFWQSLSRPRDLASEAAELAKKIDADLMIVRKDHAMAQAGFGHTKDGLQRGMFSLAAIVSKTLAIEGAYYDGHQQPVHNWLGAFKLPDGRWAYFAVRDANFLPNGDFSGTKEEVLDRLHGDYGLGGWNVVIGDQELEEQGFHNFSARRIEDLFPRKKDGKIQVHQWWSLCPAQRKTPWKAIAGISGLAIFFIVGTFLYWQMLQRQQEDERRARALEIERKKKLGQAVPVVVTHPWPQKPLPRDIAQACVSKLLLLSPGGWHLDEYACSARQITYSWSRGDSTVGYLLEQVPDAILQKSGDKSAYSVSLELASGKDEDLIPAEELMPRLHTALQLLGLSLKFPSVPTEQKLPQPADAESLPKPQWQTIPFTLDTGNLPPTQVVQIFSQPGIRLDLLSYKSGAWLIEGVIYAK